MATVYGSGTTMSWPNRVVAPPPVGQVSTIGGTGVLDADVGAVVEAAVSDGAADDVLVAPAFRAAGSRSTRPPALPSGGPAWRPSSRRAANGASRPGGSAYVLVRSLPRSSARAPPWSPTGAVCTRDRAGRTPPGAP